VKIREYKTHDIPKILELCTQLGYSTDPKGLEIRLKEISKDPTRKFFVSTDDQDNVLGWIHVWGMLQVESAGNAQIAGLVVDEVVRGQGHGRALISHAENWARENGYQSLYLLSRIQREGAHRFYEKMGFKNYKTSYAFAKELETNINNR
jgi:N-acetylglutamate synthase-like GNAT family acetyltransferase